MNEECLIFESIGPVVRLTLNRPRAFNALNDAVINAFNEALDRIEADKAVRAVIITGNGPAFCAGADLKAAVGTEAVPGKPDFLKRAGEMMQRLSELPKPVIASLNGVTMAGGLELAMCADILLAAETAQIGDAHANYGVFPGAGGAAVLPRILPLTTALYLLLSGKSLPARRLYDLGLIAEIHAVDQLSAAALDLAHQLAAKSPAALRGMKAVARGSADKSRSDALLHEQVLLREHMRSQDMQEGLRAFAEKRIPNFTGN